MRKMGKQVLTGIMITMLAVGITGCDREKLTPPDTEVQLEAVAAGAVKAEDPEIQVSVKEESFNTAFMLEIGESRKLDIETNYRGSLAYKSADEAIASVDADGNVTANRNGTVMLLVTAGDKVDTVNVVVKAPVTVVTEETTETEEAGGNGNEAVATTGTAAAANQPTAASQQVAAQTTSDRQPAAGAVETSAAPATEQAYNPADYYLDWNYIAAQVNARLKADYPNAIIGNKYEDGTESGSWFQGDAHDGYEGCMSTEWQINSCYSAIKHDLEAMGTSPETRKPMGMFIDSITVLEDGSREIVATCYR